MKIFTIAFRPSASPGPTHQENTSTSPLPVLAAVVAVGWAAASVAAVVAVGSAAVVAAMVAAVVAVGSVTAAVVAVGSVTAAVVGVACEVPAG